MCSRPGPIRGFTIIELMVVMALVAVLATLAVPSYRAFAINQQLSSAASNFLMSLLQARSEAIRLGKYVAVLPVDGSNWTSGWQLSVVTNTCAPTGAAFSKADALPPAVSVKTAGTTKSFAHSAPSFTYTPAGFPYTACSSPYYSGTMNGMLRFEAIETSRERAIIVGNAGRARLCDPRGETCAAD